MHSELDQVRTCVLAVNWHDDLRTDRVPARDLKTDRVPHHDEQLLIMTSNPDRDEDVSGGSPSWPAYSQPQMSLSSSAVSVFAL